MFVQIIGIVRLTVLYWSALWYFLLCSEGSYKTMNHFGEDTWAKVQVYSLSLMFKMWDTPHYRSATFQQDLIDNLRNVAIPGTGIPLSVFCYNYFVCLWFVFFINPLICLCGAINKYSKDESSSPAHVLLSSYEQHLLHPDDWFSFWQLNCRLTSAQSMTTKHDDFAYENKWKFLLDGRSAGVPVSPFLDVDHLVCKHMNMEGGLGIHFFKNALHGGEWIIQERMDNCAWLSDLLPGNAPLSTMRVITMSTYPLGREENSSDVVCEEELPSELLGEQASKCVTAATAVLRLGRANASTDHSSVLFDVDMGSGRIGKGLDNSHWYKLGIHNVWSCPWLPRKDTHTKHPDHPNPVVMGQVIPNMKDALDICVQSHFKLMKNAPMVGWDVAFTAKGLFLLEVNLSCNFFKGTFDVPRYINFVDGFWKSVDSRKCLQPNSTKKKKTM